MARDEELGVERRNHARATLSKLGVVERADAPASSALVMDVSATGARLKVAEPPDGSADYILHFKVEGVSYTPRFRVVRWTSDKRGHHWGGVFRDLTPEQMVSLRQAVYKLFGRPHVRPWQDIRAECTAQPEGNVLVGCTRTGREVHIAARDCLHLGAKGVRQFVLDVEDAGPV
jgi:hypothetical protein